MLGTLDQVLSLFRTLNQEHANLRNPIYLAEADPQLEAADREISAFLDQVVGLLTTLERAISTMGVKEALNLLQIRRLTEVMENQNEHVHTLSIGVEQLAQGISRVAEDTQSAAQAAGQMKEIGFHSLERLDDALQAVAGLEVRSQEAQTLVGQLVAQTKAATDGLKRIRGIAGTSQLLALNAAIQAAHANDRAFAVVAQEMRRLADTTESLVKQIEGEVAGMDQAIESTRAAMDGMAADVSTTEAKAREAANDIQAVHNLLGQVTEAVQSIAAFSEQQAAATEEISATAQELSGQVAATSKLLDLTRNLSVSGLTEEAHTALGRFNIGSQADQMRLLLNRTADEVEATVERLVAQGRVRASDLWDYNYREVKGAEIASLGRIFRVDRVPQSGFNPPKFRTAYDQQIDLALIEILDRCVTAGGLKFCGVVDLNVFGIAHGRIAIHDWTGEYEKDLRGNRIKRLLTQDPVARKGTRLGLPKHLAEKEYIAAQDVPALPGPTPSRSFLLQSYATEAGDVMLAMSVPLYLCGRRWGAINAGFTPAV